jgi:VIT1/CCC1 family predicted Fe2+/Mn2+ transporter
MDSGFVVVIYSILITCLLFVIMTKVLKQNISVATDRSVFIGTLVLLYMILFGVKFPPGKINPNLF